MKQNRLVQIERSGAIAEQLFQDAVVAFEREKWRELFAPQIPLENLPRKLSENVATARSAAVPDCTTCGACCVFLSCVAVKPGDLTPDDYVWNVTNETDGGEIVVDRFMRRTANEFACVALSGKLGENVGCRIYPERPRVCREFEAGSDKCRALRRAYGIEPELSEAEKLEAGFRVALLAERLDPTEKIVYTRIVEHPETGELVIVALLDSSANLVLHVYSPADEAWLQNEFAGLTVAQARELIVSRIQI